MIVYTASMLGKHVIHTPGGALRPGAQASYNVSYPTALASEEYHLQVTCVTTNFPAGQHCAVTARRTDGFTVSMAVPESLKWGHHPRTVQPPGTLEFHWSVTPLGTHVHCSASNVEG